MITEVGAVRSASGADVLDADGLVALPGLVDLHTHLREPGREDAETIATGSAAAAVGGFTAVLAMANTSPVTDTAEAAERVLDLGRAAGLRRRAARSARSARAWRASELAELGAHGPLAGAGQGLLRRRQLRGRLRCSCAARWSTSARSAASSPSTPRTRASPAARLLPRGRAVRAAGPARLAGRRRGDDRRPRRACSPGTPAPACTSATSPPPAAVEVIRWAKAQGIDVTAEVTPHHLLLTTDLLAGYDPVFKVNPPLRPTRTSRPCARRWPTAPSTRSATDHAPHARARQGARVRRRGLRHARARDRAGGRQRRHGRHRPARLGRRGPGHVRNAGRIAGLSHHGRPLAVGEPANVTLVDPSADVTVDRAIASLRRNTPCTGATCAARSHATVLRGRVTALKGGLA